MSARTQISGNPHSSMACPAAKIGDDFLVPRRILVKVPFRPFTPYRRNRQPGSSEYLPGKSGTQTLVQQEEWFRCRRLQAAFPIPRRSSHVLQAIHTSLQFPPHYHPPSPYRRLSMSRYGFLPHRGSPKKCQGGSRRPRLAARRRLSRPRRTPGHRMPVVDHWRSRGKTDSLANPARDTCWQRAISPPIPAATWARLSRPHPTTLRGNAAGRSTATKPECESRYISCHPKHHPKLPNLCQRPASIATVLQ